MFLPAGIAMAQTTPEAEELRLRSREEAEERARRQQAPDVRLRIDVEPSAAFVLPEETPCFVVQDIRLTGTRLDAFPWVQGYFDQFAGQCAGVKGLNLILKGLSGKFIEKGYITTRVLLPEQDISTGRLEFLLVPGVVREIRFSSEVPERTWKTGFPVRPGDLLNLRDIEQGLEQMKRVPSQDVSFNIVPGAQQGESDIVIDITRVKPWRVVLSVDDTGAEATGKLQSSVAAYLDNPLGLNDTFSVSINGDMEQKGGERGSRGDSVSYSVPWGYWTVAGSSSANYYHQTIQGLTQSFVSSGTIESAELKVNRVIDRDQASKTALQVRVVKRRNRSYIDDTEVTVQRREVTSAEVSALYRRYFGQAQLDATLSYRQGVDWLDAQPEPAERQPGQPTTHYKIQTLDASLVAPFSLGDVTMRYYGSFRAQTTDDYLFTSEFFSIGNRYTVRGFDGERTLAAERGWFLRNEIDVPLISSGLSLYVGLDGGEVAGSSANLLIGTTLIGGAVGLRGGANGFAYDMFAGWPLDKPEGYITEPVTVGAQISYQF
jgi:hemolysin activation/secretion protein